MADVYKFPGHELVTIEPNQPIITEAQRVCALAWETLEQVMSNKYHAPAVRIEAASVALHYGTLIALPPQAQ